MIERPSPNHGTRRGGARPDMVVLHYTAMASAEAALERLCDPATEVSCHWLIAEDGRLFRLVDEARRAWHAGAGAWGGCADVNSRSIGVELANDGAHPFPEPQMAALEALLDGIMARWPVPARRVIGHQDCAPLRKQDPGPHFDWRRLARGRRAIWLDATAATADIAPQRAARRFGYACHGITWEDAEPAIAAAFRARFRPWARAAGVAPPPTAQPARAAGVAPSSTAQPARAEGVAPFSPAEAAHLAALAARYPVAD